MPPNVILVVAVESPRCIIIPLFASLSRGSFSGMHRRLARAGRFTSRPLFRPPARRKAARFTTILVLPQIPRSHDRAGWPARCRVSIREIIGSHRRRVCTPDNFAADISMAFRGNDMKNQIVGRIGSGLCCRRFHPTWRSRRTNDTFIAYPCCHVERGGARRTKEKCSSRRGTRKPARKGLRARARAYRPHILYALYILMQNAAPNTTRFISSTYISRTHNN